MNNYPVGTKLEIINAGTGALGCNGKIGIVTYKESRSGIRKKDKGFNIEIINGDVWRVSFDGRFKVLGTVGTLRVGEQILPKTKVHIHKKLPYTFNSIVEDPEGNFIESQVVKGDSSSYRVVYEGNKTVVILEDGSVGIAKRNPEYPYSINIGTKLAYTRALIKQLNKKIKSLEKGIEPEERRVLVIGKGYQKHFGK